MAYRRTNKLHFIIAVQNTYQQYKIDGVTTRWVYDNHIKPVYHISIATMYSYLGVRAQAELKKLEEQKQEAESRYKQTSMF